MYKIRVLLFNEFHSYTLRVYKYKSFLLYFKKYKREYEKRRVEGRSSVIVRLGNLTEKTVQRRVKDKIMKKE